MNLATWSAVNDYYRSLWTEFSLQKLADALDENVTAKHVHYGNDIISGKEAVLQQYKKTFFDTCSIDSTRVYNFSMDVAGADRVKVSFSIKQHHCDERATRISQYKEILEVSPLTAKIVYIEMLRASSCSVENVYVPE